MVVVADPTTGTVTIRLSTAALTARTVLAAIVGLGAPAMAERFAPGLLVPALVVTACAAAWVVHGLGRTVVLDDHGVTLGTSRRGARRLAWTTVADLVVVDGHLVVETVDGRSVRGPRLTADVLAGARENAAVLGLQQPR